MLKKALENMLRVGRGLHGIVHYPVGGEEHGVLTHLTFITPLCLSCEMFLLVTNMN